MPRRLRIEFDGAIYHVMSRGNARQDIIHDDDDRRRLLADLERVVARAAWELLSFVLLDNHVHLLLRTPRPNLARGMQAFLSGYALWSGRRRRRPGGKPGVSSVFPLAFSLCSLETLPLWDAPSEP